MLRLRQAPANLQLFYFLQVYQFEKLEETPPPKKAAQKLANIHYSVKIQSSSSYSAGGTTSIKPSAFTH